MKRLMITAALAALLAACGGSDGEARQQQPAAPASTPASGAPVEQPAPNAPNQRAAFAGQTRVPEVRSNVAFQAQDYVTGIGKPWGMAFLPNGALLITEKAGNLRLFENGKLSAPIAGVPKVDARGQGGLLGLAIHPDYARNGLVYFVFSEGDQSGNHTALGRGRLVSSTGAAPRLENVQVIWRQTPSLKSTLHYGGRVVFAPDGTLFVTTGERSIDEGRMQAQRLDGTLGKVIHLNADGSVPASNPFVNRAGAKPEIWSYGHRNIQGAAINPRNGELWTIEHGARGGDEINIPKPGRDYGWPTIAYGIEYSGAPILTGITQKEGMEQPVYYWDPVIAPSGMAFYNADLFPAWKGSVFVGGMAGQALVRLSLDDDKVVGEERLLTDLGERIRDVIVGPDGALYVAIDSDPGRIMRIAPR
ncbi:PQQ-dependent sugar dehydrogenase [Phenylobacterium deserti]|uniref:PQQ-dependent sugar dehydrogenase n=1 Tax=Phenylobacterium deserti TaxID=1914756 RepID=A0A328AVA9_9CAUL|nr:PQQ-dependent sugar dehydrogenase [Phenylobacterium deserti]RAK58101.1 PQQ-dependent sugar dehydrogenase [Phenylobacterium deserti]